MGVRPPQQDDDETEAVEFGIAALAARIRESELSFPADRDEVVRELGNPSIPVDAHGRSVSLSTALDELEGHQFDSEQELLNALHPVFEAFREKASAGFLGSLRSLFPF